MFTRLLAEVGKGVKGKGKRASAGYMAQAIADGAELNSFVTVAAWLHDSESLQKVFGEKGVRRRMEAGMAALQKYEQTGQVQYVPAYKQNDPKAAMSARWVITASRLVVPFPSGKTSLR